MQDADLKGVSVGGAEVSQLHSGFLINKGGATATDILQLMKIVQATVMDRFGVMLEPEVRIIGRRIIRRRQRIMNCCTICIHIQHIPTEREASKIT